jgi:hypothetical protein
VDNIRIDLLQLEWGDVDWVGLAQNRNRWRPLLNSVLSLRVPKNAGKLSRVLTTRDLSSAAQFLKVSLVMILSTPPVLDICKPPWPVTG